MILVVLLGWGVYTLTSERKALTEELGGLRADLSVLETENISLRDKLEYFKQPENLVKELKQFNYTETGEQLLIVVPSGTGTER